MKSLSSKSKLLLFTVILLVASLGFVLIIRSNDTSTPSAQGEVKGQYDNAIAECLRSAPEQKVACAQEIGRQIASTSASPQEGFAECAKLRPHLNRYCQEEIGE